MLGPWGCLAAGYEAWGEVRLHYIALSRAPARRAGRHDDLSAGVGAARAKSVVPGA